MQAVSDGAVYLQMDAAFHLATIWLNGGLIGTFHSGYVPIEVPLLSVIPNGKENVLAIRTDASFGSGHWYEGGWSTAGGLWSSLDPRWNLPPHKAYVQAEHLHCL